MKKNIKLPPGFTLKRRRGKYILFYMAGRAKSYSLNAKPELIKKDAENFLLHGFPDEFPPFD